VHYAVASDFSHAATDNCERFSDSFFHFNNGGPSLSGLPLLDNFGQISDDVPVRCCPKPKNCLILLVELARIERATS
jgi:hypothetical protein